MSPFQSHPSVLSFATMSCVVKGEADEEERVTFIWVDSLLRSEREEEEE